MPQNRQALGIELVRRGIVTQEDISKAIEYQTNNPREKIGDIIYDLKLADPRKLLQAMGEILEEKTIFLLPSDIKIKVTNYISLDIVKEDLAVPFEIDNGIIKVCFASTSNRSQMEAVRLLMLNKGLVMESYITFRALIEDIINELDKVTTSTIDIEANGASIVDNIIKTGMEQRASDIHIEPLEDYIRVRYRIDGLLFDVAHIDKEKQTQIIGRLKSISNMHQEKQEPQDYNVSRL